MKTNMLQIVQVFQIKQMSSLEIRKIRQQFTNIRKTAPIQFSRIIQIKYKIFFSHISQFTNSQKPC